MVRTAFVLGGGGVLGAAEAGMARALLEVDVVPDLIFGTSIEAINGAAIAADLTLTGVQKLLATWEELAADVVLGGSLVGRFVELVRPAITQRWPPGSTQHGQRSTAGSTTTRRHRNPPARLTVTSIGAPALVELMRAR